MNNYGTLQPLVNVTDDGDLCIEWWKGDRKVTCYAKPDYPLIVVDERGPSETSRKIGEALDWLNEERHHAYPQPIKPDTGVPWCACPADVCRVDQRCYCRHTGAYNPERS